MSTRKDNLFINPQGIGDLAIPLKFFIINFITKPKLKNDFIIQYQSQKDIIENYNKSKTNYFFSKIFYKLDKNNFKSFLKLKKRHYNSLFIDPNISLFKAVILSLIIKSKIKIYKKFFLHELFFNKSPNYDPIQRKKYYITINNQLNKNKDYLILKKKKIKKKILGIAPGTGKLELHRRWDYNNFIDIINNLKSKYDLIYIFGNEKELMSKISSVLKSKYKIISYKNINKSLEKLREIQTLVTNDNGIANFAANYGLKCNIICGPSKPYSIQNYKNVNIISNNLSCSPCYDKNRYGCGNPICLSQLKSKSVQKKLI